MVSVCSGCDFYHPLTAAMLGSIAGMLYLFTSALMVKLRYINTCILLREQCFEIKDHWTQDNSHVLRVDDPVDAVAVHCGSGLLSILLAPLFR